MGPSGAGLKVQIPVPVQHRGAKAPQRHAIKAGARVDVEQVVLELFVLRGGRGRVRRGGGVRAGGGRRGSPPTAVRVPTVALRRAAQAAAAAGGVRTLLSAAGRVLVQAERVAGVRRAAERRAGRDHDGRRRAHAQASPAAPQHVHSSGLLAIRYLLGY